MYEYGEVLDGENDDVWVGLGGESQQHERGHDPNGKEKQHQRRRRQRRQDQRQDYHRRRKHQNRKRTQAETHKYHISESDEMKRRSIDLLFFFLMRLRRFDIM
ncbi:hypothetical protein PanWU01x14_203230 [Parasponia andersonii]|uniref:Uncharacterized protein n=1 Tax=Parasponia andersonii TaxID=3476 RepID=A0A2P5BX09_PARAD|nr:hypothetical protein PanWU01x14_203230 [Parasponia andersonii]